MKKILFLVSLLCTIQQLLAADGDTTKVRVFDTLPMIHYGTFDTWTKFPAVAAKHQRIWMKLSLGCSANGQCEWDYTLKLAAREHTGKQDSTQKQAPSFTVNGQVKDSVHYSSDTTYMTVFNSSTKTVKLVANSMISIVQYGDPAHPLTATNTLNVWPSGYYTYNFDSTGKKKDSLWFGNGPVLHLSYTPYYEKFEVVNNYELSRMITPYAKYFPKSFRYEYLYDVTDLASLLHDSTEIRLIYEGYTYGFTSTVDFYFVEGTVAREAYKVQNVYSGYFPYGNGSDPIENYLTPKSLTVDPNADQVKLRITVTGHGGESNEGCSEFCAKNYYLKVNGTQIAKQLIWKDDCGSNPIINQGGTWIYDRANWCPGELVKVFEYPLTAKAGDNLAVDIDMDDFTANGSAGYGYEVQLVSYKARAYTTDAGIEQILSPTNDFWQSQSNPACDNAKIRVRNFGKSTITSMEFKYQLGNSSVVKTGTWSGAVKPEESTEVVFPWMDWKGDVAAQTFKVWLTKVNGASDANSSNNTMSSMFDMPQVLPQTFVVELKTNVKNSENTYSIKDSYGKVKYSKTFATANTLYRDTIKLGYGCYTFELNDDGGNGLSFWATPNDGNGTVRIVGIPLSLIKTFNPDFGNFVRLNFRVGSQVGIEEAMAGKADELSVYPQPASDKLFVKLNGRYPQSVTLTDLNGRTVRTYSAAEAASGELDIIGIQTGLYILNWQNIDHSFTAKKVVINK